ncbi:unnamed protein product [Sphagnum jensenii]|uniref:CRAL-TRIO domain-containing protein n=1 Tax=Sphagnum jensenii TaxID=128206 RepID=A0ABP0VUK6_9BRYO
MRRGHSDQQQHKADGAAEQCETEVGCADNCFNRRKPEKLLWNFPQNRGRNSLAVAKVQEKKILVRKCISSFMENKPQLDLVVADNVFAFLAMLQKVPGGAGTRSFEDVSPTPKVQGHASADLSSVHEECRSNIQTLEEGDADTPMETDSKMGHSVETALSCTTSEGDPNHSLDCSLDSQTVEIASKILHDPSNQINAVCSHLKSIASRGPNSVSQMQKSDSQQRGRWCRTILSSLAGAVGLKMLSPRTHWPLLEFVIFPWLRLPLEKESRERAPILRGRRWWHLPAKVAMAFSSQFCGPLSNPLAAAHVLLLILELRGKQQERLAAENQLQGAFCKTCLLKLDQVMHQFALSKGGDKKVQPGWQQKHASAAHHAGGSQGLRCDTCFEKAYEEALQSDQDLPWDWTEEIAQLIACSQNAGTTGCRTTVVPAGEDISPSTVSFNEALDSPGNMLSCSSSSSSLSIEDPSNKGHFWSSSCGSLSTEDPSENAISCTSSCGSFSTEDSPQGVEPASFENKENALGNQLLLESMLPEKSDMGVNSPPCTTDSDDESFFEASTMSLPDLEFSEERLLEAGTHHEIELNQLCSSRTADLDDCQDLSISTLLAGGDEYTDILKTMQIFSEQEAVRAVSESDTSLQDQILPCAEATLGEDACCSGTGDLSPPVLLLSDSKAVLQSENGVFCPHADHPTCISLRERRHTHGDQKYFTMQELITAPWSELVFWHGHCQQGNPTLCVLLGKAIQKLPAPELSNLVPIIVSHMEYAELNFFKGPSKQVNIVLDLWGLGLMRIPPMDILQRVGTFLNRDYAGRGGSVFVINAPMMLSLVMGGIKRVILCPAYNKGAMIDKGFIESKERIFLLGRQFKPVLEKHFDFTMLPSVFGGQCSCRILQFADTNSLG